MDRTRAFDSRPDLRQVAAWIDPGARVLEPVIAAYFVASLAASQILAYCEKQSSEITGKVISLDYQSLTHPQVATIARHPLCGCAF